MKLRLNRLIPLLLILFIGLVSCNRSPKQTTPGASENNRMPAASVTAATPAGAGNTQPENSKNGEQLYFRAIDLQGNGISYSGGPQYGGMMGNYLTCASCHGPAAHGGKHTMMMMQTMDAPPIYYDALAQMAQKDAGKNAYTLDDFRKAVNQGQDIDGSALSQDMPRWQMSDQDLADLFAFLKTIHE